MKKSKKCFVISAIGQKKTETYKNAKNVLDKIIKPALEDIGYTVKRSDYSDKPGSITKDMIYDIVTSDLVIANLTPKEYIVIENPDILSKNGKSFETNNISGKLKKKPILQFNANVFYELGLRHTLNLPIIPIIDGNIPTDLPFDNKDYRVIKYDLNRPSCAIKEIRKMLKNIKIGKLNTFVAEVLKDESVIGITYDEFVFGTSRHIINWKNSGQLEMNAENVYAITSDLNWAHYHIKKLIKDTKGTPKINNIHCYILVEKRPEENDYKTEIEWLITRKKLDKHFEIRCINSAKYNEIIIGSKPKNLLPLHSDFVIYENTKHPIMTKDKTVDYLVISSTSVPASEDEIEKRLGSSYDNIFKEREQVNKVKYWFKHLWQEIGKHLQSNGVKTYIDLR